MKPLSTSPSIVSDVKTARAAWVERFFYAPSMPQRAVALLLWPFSLLYCLIAWIRYLSKSPQAFHIPIVSIGNLTVGGSGKTPLTTALALKYDRPAIVLRGYGRKSRGLIVVSNGEKTLCGVDAGGDEAMIYAQKVSHAVVIVSEERKAGIHKAHAMGCDVVFLDDGYGKHQIKKLDVVIAVDTQNRFCLPAGPYRERLWPDKKVIVVKEGVDFKRQTSLKNVEGTMTLVTAIARPQRLDPFLPTVLEKHYFPDHFYFEKHQLETILKQSGADRLLVTYKDYVKIRDFGLPLALLDLELDLKSELVDAVEQYIREYDEN